MKSPESSGAARLQRHQVEAAGSLICHDSRRLRDVAARLRTTGGVIESTVRGASMLPTIPSGSRIRIAFADRDGEWENQVVAFLAGTTVVVHRVVHESRRRGLRVTRGDANRVPDRPIDRAHLIGPVTGIRANGAWEGVPAVRTRGLGDRVVAQVLLGGTIAACALGPRWGSAFVSLLEATSARVRRVTRILEAMTNARRESPFDAAGASSSRSTPVRSSHTRRRRSPRPPPCC